ncbi:MAG: acetate kinase [Deltaproteobacteria bacterium]|nr:acetate kinase [Deltaproteobacteria bacterium]
MKILVLNSGSSSLKFILFDMHKEAVLVSGMVDRIGIPESIFSIQQSGGVSEVIQTNIPDHGAALGKLFEFLTMGPIPSLPNIPAIAHRVAHGGKFRESVVITPEVIDQITSMNRFFPLHNPAIILEIEECMKRMPHSLHVAVFDNSFHRDIPDEAAIYGLPYRYFSEKGYKRTGYHGNSHAFSAFESSKFLRRPIENLRLITCHLGNGASTCAIKHGKSIDTSLGITATEGLIMGTRSGDIDPGLIPIIMDEEGLSSDDISDMLVHRSGLFGISGLSRDMREIENAAAEGHKRATLALNAFCYKVKRSIGSMLMALGGCDGLVFTGGIGVNSSIVRLKSLEGTENLGFMIDPVRNSESTFLTMENPVKEISAENSPISILVIRANEELMMARECYRITRQLLEV